MELLLILLVGVLVLGLAGGGLLLSRRSRGRVIPVPPSTPKSSLTAAASDTRTRDDEKVFEDLTRGLDLEGVDLQDTVVEEAVVEEAVVEQAVPEADLVVEPRPRFRDRLGKARGLLAGYLGSIRSRGVDDETWEELEEALIRADVGVDVTTELLDELRSRAKAEGIKDPDRLLNVLKDQVKEQMGGRDRSLRLDTGTTNVWLFVGVNGVGKTTTIGKVARQQMDAGRTVLMAAGDTFRAAAAEQLETWAERSGADFVRGAEGADPSAVIFDGIQRAHAKGYDLVLADTAGRLHNKSNLMDELRKVRRVAGRDPGNVTETLLVLDAVTGQNGLAQAKEFTETVDVTGVVLTKLDGSAKGGIVLAIERRLGIPVKLVGLGETAADLIVFDPDEFIDALFE